jgi:adenylate kinase
MDRGDLVPDELITRVIAERVDSDEARDGFLLDGFPRTVPQAESLEEALEGLGRRLTATLLIEAPDEAVIKRLSGRRVCRDNGHTYHVDFDPPKNDGFCDQDGSKLVQRDDDKPETVKHRLHVFHDQTKPLVERYEDQGILRRFDGTRSPEEVSDHIRATLATLKLEEEL